MDTKIDIFETIVHKLKDWFMEQNGIDTIEDFNKCNDFSILKLIKLHFFVTSINSNDDGALLDKFDFFAMPYGPVETDIYSKIKSDPFFSNFSINNFKANFTGDVPTKVIEGDLIISIDIAINMIKEIDASFVNADAGSLVELTHKWDSWRTVYSEAVKSGSYSKRIDRNLIIKDNKVLNLELTS